jgi:hypothetical protein
MDPGPASPSRTLAFWHRRDGQPPKVTAPLQLYRQPFGPVGNPGTRTEDDDLKTDEPIDIPVMSCQ